MLSGFLALLCCDIGFLGDFGSICGFSALILVCGVWLWGILGLCISGFDFSCLFWVSILYCGVVGFVLFGVYFFWVSLVVCMFDWVLGALMVGFGYFRGFCLFLFLI